MQMFQIRKMNGSKSTVIIPKILGINEEVYNGETTIHIYFGHDNEQEIQSTDKIIEFSWEYTNGKYNRVEKEIKFEEFHDWLIEQIAEIKV